MGWIAQVNLSVVVVFALVLTRVSGLVAAAPIAGMQQTPMQVRGLLVLALALLLTPAQWTGDFAAPANLVEFGLMIGGELFVGVILGLGVQFLFSGIQLGGLLISQASGISLADTFNPELNTEIPVFSQLMHLVAITVFVALGGQRMLIAGLLNTFETLPLGSLAGIPSVAELFTTLVAQSFELGVRVAAPCVVALLLTTLVMGLIGRTLPQLNVMSFGFGANSLVTLAMFSISIAAVLWILQDDMEPWLEQLMLGLEAAI